MRGLVFVSSGEIVQRFLHSRAFEKLQVSHDLTYVFWDSQSLAAPQIDVNALGLPRVKFIRYRDDRFAKWKELFDVSCVHYQDRSESFKIRTEIHQVKRKEIFPLARPGKFESYRNRLLSSLGYHPEMESLLKNERPDFVVLPSSLLDTMTDDVLRIAERYKIPTFLLVSGWDNLSSKGILTYMPTFVGAWGEQTKRHAIEVQKIAPEKVTCLGAPHYEAFRKIPVQDRATIRLEQGLPTDRKVVLFGGSFRQFDETNLLKQIEDEVEKGTLPPTHILYRPHPWRAPRDDEPNFFDYAWNHITMDPAIAGVYRDTKMRKAGAVDSNEFLFSMDYLNQLYRSVDAVISPLSTLVLESMLFGNPVLAVAYNSGDYLWSADKTAQMTHFQEMNSMPGVSFCRAPNDFIPLLQQLLAQADDLALRPKIRSATGYLVVQDDLTYAERLNQMVTERLGHQSPPAPKPIWQKLFTRATSG